MTTTVHVGDCREVLRALPDASVHCIVTSPPYYGLRDYGVDGQIGREDTPGHYVDQLAIVFREARRVLRGDGVMFLNLGDSYSGSEKQLLGIPWRVAFALQADGWYLRQDIIWHKPNPMPESVTDRCTKAHEYVFLLAKSARYWYDADAIKEDAIYSNDDRKGRATDDQKRSPTDRVAGIRPRKSVPRGGFDGKTNALEGREAFRAITDTRNKRDVWTIATEPSPIAHFAMMPTALAETCIKAGCPVGGTCLDPFGGAGTTGLVADQLGRSAILIELNPEYATLARNRIGDDAGMFSEVA